MIENSRRSCTSREFVMDQSSDVLLHLLQWCDSDDLVLFSRTSKGARVACRSAALLCLRRLGDANVPDCIINPMSSSPCLALPSLLTLLDFRLRAERVKLALASNQNGCLDVSRFSNWAQPTLSVAVLENGSSWTFDWDLAGTLRISSNLEVIFGQIGGAEDCEGMPCDWPTKAPFSNMTHVDWEQVADLARGFDFTVMLTKTGRVLSWGKGSIGHGDDGYCPLPRPVAALKRVKVVQVACGDDHTLVLDGFGGVKSFGASGLYALGRADDDTYATPQPITFPKEENEVLITSIACGAQHSCVLSSEGVMFTFGLGFRGRLGHDSEVHERFPRAVQTIRHLNVIQIACGHAHTVGLTNNGRVFAWGENELGALGSVAYCPFSAKPTEIARSPKVHRIVQVGASDFDTVVVDSRGNVYSLGRECGSSLDPMFLGQGSTADWDNNWYSPNITYRMKCDNLVHLTVANSRKGSHEFDETISLQSTILMVFRLMLCMCSLYVCVSLLSLRDCEPGEYTNVHHKQEAVDGSGGGEVVYDTRFNGSFESTQWCPLDANCCRAKQVPWQRFIQYNNVEFNFTHGNESENAYCVLESRDENYPQLTHVGYLTCPMVGGVPDEDVDVEYVDGGSGNKNAEDRLRWWVSPAVTEGLGQILMALTHLHGLLSMTSITNVGV